MVSPQPCDTPQVPPAGAGSDEGSHVSGQLRHPGLVTQDAAPSGAATRVHSQHRHPVPTFSQLLPENFCKCRDMSVTTPSLLLGILSPVNVLFPAPGGPESPILKASDVFPC